MTSQADIKQELDSAIEQLYSLFLRYHKRSTILGCPCCVDRKDEKRLHSKPLRELTADDLYEFAFSSLYTWGELEDFKHFLPRLFELAATEDHLPFNHEILFGKLSYGGFNGWPPDEQAAVTKYFIAAWESLLASDSDSYDMDAWLCGLAELPRCGAWRL